MDERPLVEGYIANFGISVDVFEFLRFGRLFYVLQKNWVFGYSWSTLPSYWCYCLLSASVERCFVSRMQYCFLLFIMTRYRLNTTKNVFKWHFWEFLYPYAATPPTLPRPSKCLQRHQQRWCKFFWTGVIYLL